MRTGGRWIFVIATCLSLSACSIPISEQPLTSEMPSPLDERVIGTWEIDMTPLGDKEKNNQVVVRRMKDDAQWLEVIGLSDGEEQGEQSSTLIACHHAMHDYLSYGPFRKHEKKGYAICLYEFDDADHGRLYLLDSDYVVDAIERGLIAGHVSREGARISGVILSAPPEELRQFLTKHSPTCFATKHPMVARRVK